MLFNEVGEVFAEWHRTFPTETPAQAAALAWWQMVSRAGRFVGRAQHVD